MPVGMFANPTTETVAAYWTGPVPPEGQNPRVSNQEPSYKNYQDTYMPHGNHIDVYLGTARDTSGNRYGFWYCATDHKITCITMDGQSAPSFTFVAYKTWNDYRIGRFGLTKLQSVTVDPKQPGAANVVANAGVSASAADSVYVSRPGTMDVWWDPTNKVLNCDTVSLPGNFT